MQTVRVRLRKPNRVITFLSNNIPLGRNDPCVVRSDRGLEYGVCILPPEDCSDEEQKRYKMNVIRKATHHDQTTHTQILYDENMAKRTCGQKIREREMPMKLVEAEYTFDRRKIIFYFTAEERVDFRELVRDLAAEFKARIELRHIQVRDEAKMLGGIGTCGRELCCTTWMSDFMPISMKMAKRQNLSLNPTKISGQCGRLMCCLSYENELYKKSKRQGGLRPETNSERLARVQDTMQEDAEETVRVLRKSSLKDVPPREDDAERKPRRRKERRPERRERGERSDRPEQRERTAAAPAAERETKPATAPEPRARKQNAPKPEHREEPARTPARTPAPRMAAHEPETTREANAPAAAPPVAAPQSVAPESAAPQVEAPKVEAPPEAAHKAAAPRTDAPEVAATQQDAPQKPASNDDTQETEAQRKRRRRHKKRRGGPKTD